MSSYRQVAACASMGPTSAAMRPQKIELASALSTSGSGTHCVWVFCRNIIWQGEEGGGLRLPARKPTPVASVVLHLIMDSACQARAGCQAVLEVNVLQLQHVQLRRTLEESGRQLAPERTQTFGTLDEMTLQNKVCCLTAVRSWSNLRLPLNLVAASSATYLSECPCI